MATCAHDEKKNEWKNKRKHVNKVKGKKLKRKCDVTYLWIN